MANPSTYFAPFAALPGPTIQEQGMSPTLPEGSSVNEGTPVSFGPRQLPLSYGSISARTVEGHGLANGVSPLEAGSSSSQVRNGGQVSGVGPATTAVGSRDDLSSSTAGLMGHAITGLDDSAATSLGPV